MIITKLPVTAVAGSVGQAADLSAIASLDEGIAQGAFEEPTGATSAPPSFDADQPADPQASRYLPPSAAVAMKALHIVLADYRARASVFEPPSMRDLMFDHLLDRG